MGKLVKHRHTTSEQYPDAIKDNIEKVESRFLKYVQKKLNVINKKLVEYTKLRFQVNKTPEEIQKIFEPEDFQFNLIPLAEVAQIASDYSRDLVIQKLLKRGIYIKRINAEFGVDLSLKAEQAQYIHVLSTHADYLAQELGKTTFTIADKWMQTGYAEGWTYDEIATKLSTALGFDKTRAVKIARTEINWAVNEGVRMDLERIGYREFEIDAAPNACPLCVEKARARYKVTELNILPIHPMCRCVMVGVPNEEWLQFLKVSSDEINIVSKSLTNELTVLKNEIKDIPRVIKGIDGKDGYTPIKGKDYFDGKDGESIKGDSGKDGSKGIDGIDGKDGYTPIKGKDYFTTQERRDFIKSIIEKLKTRELIDKSVSKLERRLLKVTKPTGLTKDDVNRIITQELGKLKIITPNTKWGKLYGTITDQQDLIDYINTHGGVGTFLDLSDTPDSYVGQAGKLVVVKGDETGLEFTNGNPGDITSVVAGTGLAGGGTSGDVTLTNADTGSGAVAAHNLAFTHADIALNTADRHSRQHSITSTSDHTSTATAGKILKADVNGLPIEATNTDSQVASAVSSSHDAVTLPTDSGLSITGQQLSMGTPSTITGTSTNTITTNTHTHAVTGFTTSTDLLGYLMKSPSSATYNTITIPNATYNGLVIKGFTGQTANLTEWKNSSLTVLSYINSNGQKFGLNSIQALYIPDQTIFSGSMFVGSGGESLIHSSGTDGVQNTALGIGAGSSITRGYENVVIGYLAANNLTNGYRNVIIGSSAGNQVSTGASNTLIGSLAGAFITTGDNTTCIGAASGSKITTGSANTCIGSSAGSNITTGSSNTIFGSICAANITIGGSNTVIGSNAAALYTSSNFNTIIGRYAAGEGTGSSNTAIGYQAGYFGTGNGNVMIGYSAGFWDTGSNKLYIANSDTSTPLIYGLFSGTGAGITIHSQAIDGVPLIIKGIASQSANLQEWKNSIGTVLARISSVGNYFASLGTNTTNFFIGGAGNTTTTTTTSVGIGEGALIAMTNGTANFGIGVNAGTRITSGNYNIAIGTNALSFVTTTDGSMAIGTSSLLYATGSDNTGIGVSSGTGTYPNNTGSRNTFIGRTTAYLIAGGSDDLAFGYQTLYNTTTGSENIAIGNLAGYTNTTGSSNVFIGFKAGYYETGSSKLFIDNAPRSSEADGRAKALIYGIFHANTVSQYLNINGNLNVSETVIFNEGGLSTSDFRVESDSDANLLFIDASADKIGIGTNTPTVGVISIGGNVTRTVGMERHTTSNTAGNDLTIQGGGSTSGATDKDGGMVVLQPGLSTGTGKGSIRFKRLGRASATGTTDNVLYDAHVIGAEKAVTSEASVDLFEVALPSGGMCGGSITQQIMATDGTDLVVHSGTVLYSAVNKGGVYTTNIVDEPAVSSSDASSKAGAVIADAWAITAGTNKITISVTPAVTNLVANDIRIYYTIHSGGRNAVTQL